MTRVDPGGGGDVIVTPQVLQDMGGIFSKSADDTLNLEISLNTEATDLVNEMSSVLNQSPDAIQRFFNRWRDALFSLSDSYNSIGMNMLAVSNGAKTWDANITRE